LNIHVLDIEPPFQLVKSVPGGAPASEDIDRGVTLLRPGMDGHVGFGQKHHPRYTARGELVYGDLDDREAAFMTSGKKAFPNMVGIID
jgi:hypothetical protein